MAVQFNLLHFRIVFFWVKFHFLTDGLAFIGVSIFSRGALGVPHVACNLVLTRINIFLCNFQISSACVAPLVIYALHFFLNLPLVFSLEPVQKYLLFPHPTLQVLFVIMLLCRINFCLKKKAGSQSIGNLTVDSHSFLLINYILVSALCCHVWYCYWLVLLMIWSWFSENGCYFFSKVCANANIVWCILSVRLFYMSGLTVTCGGP